MVGLNPTDGDSTAPAMILEHISMAATAKAWPGPMPSALTLSIAGVVWNQIYLYSHIQPEWAMTPPGFCPPLMVVRSLVRDR